MALGTSIIALSLVVGNYFSCALTQNKIFCWGDNKRGQMQIPTLKSRPLEITAGGYHACVRTSEMIQCWGSNQWKQLEVPEGIQKKAAEIQSLKSGTSFTCATFLDKSVQCWGDNRSGQLNFPISIQKIKHLSTGANHLCFTREIQEGTDQIDCLGANEKKQSEVPEFLKKKDIQIDELSTGTLHSCVIVRYKQAQSKVKCWGDNSVEQTELPFPIYNARLMRSGAGNNCVVADNAVKCWGWNTYQQSSPPQEVTANISDLQLGVSHGCALISGKITCWGNSDSHLLDVPDEIRLK